jgi:dTDP-glucose 4,6-dehydratase
MATLPKVLINRADYQIGGGVALRLRTQGGLNVRDWLFVDDHAQALLLVLERGRVGETYNIGGNAERRNIDVVGAICAAMDQLTQCPSASSHRELINFVPDRPGHDFRYAIDCTDKR